LEDALKLCEEKLDLAALKSRLEGKQFTYLAYLAAKLRDANQLVEGPLSVERIVEVSELQFTVQDGKPALVNQKVGHKSIVVGDMMYSTMTNPETLTSLPNYFTGYKQETKGR